MNSCSRRRERAVARPYASRHDALYAPGAPRSPGASELHGLEFEDRITVDAAHLDQFAILPLEDTEEDPTRFRSAYIPMVPVTAVVVDLPSGADRARPSS